MAELTSTVICRDNLTPDYRAGLLPPYHKTFTGTLEKKEWRNFCPRGVALSWNVLNDLGLDGTSTEWREKQNVFVIYYRRANRKKKKVFQVLHSLCVP